MECGAFDGFFLANTLDLEVKHGWTGLLIEASSASYQILLTRNRKALSSNVCLSLEPYPTEVCIISQKYIYFFFLMVIGPENLLDWVYYFRE